LTRSAAKFSQKIAHALREDTDRTNLALRLNAAPPASADAGNESREPRDRPQCCREEDAAMDLQRFLIGLGLVILVVGVLWPMLSRIGIGRLPGDIMFQRGGATFYFPLATSIIVSIVLSVLFWLFNR
jgi:hypothetical protein